MGSFSKWNGPKSFRYNHGMFWVGASLHHRPIPLAAFLIIEDCLQLATFRPWISKTSVPIATYDFLVPLVAILLVLLRVVQSM